MGDITGDDELHALPDTHGKQTSKSGHVGFCSKTRAAETAVC